MNKRFFPVLGFLEPWRRIESQIAGGQMVVLESQEQGGHNCGDKWQSLSRVAGPHLCNAPKVVKGPQSSLPDRWAPQRGAGSL